MEILHSDPLYSISGFLVGALIGMTGVGGGSLMTPILILLFGVHPGAAVGTDLLFASVTKTVGTAVHGASRTVDWRIVARLALGSLPASLLTLALMAHFGTHGRTMDLLISSVLATALFTTAAILVFRGHILAAFGERLANIEPRRTARITVAMGGILGILVSISSVGAGAIGVTALILLYPRLPVARVVGSDIAHAVPLTLLAGAGHWILGLSDLGLLFWLLVGSIPGIMIGSYAAPRIPEAALRYLLAGTLLAAGSRLVL